jgi:hypothetical protein
MTEAIPLDRMLLEARINFDGDPDIAIPVAAHVPTLNGITTFVPAVNVACKTCPKPVGQVISANGLRVFESHFQFPAVRPLAAALRASGRRRPDGRRYRFPDSMRYRVILGRDDTPAVLRTYCPRCGPRVIASDLLLRARRTVRV